MFNILDRFGNKIGSIEPASGGGLGIFVFLIMVVFVCFPFMAIAFRSEMFGNLSKLDEGDPFAVLLTVDIIFIERNIFHIIVGLIFGIVLCATWSFVLSFIGIIFVGFACILAEKIKQDKNKYEITILLAED